MTREEAITKLHWLKAELIKGTDLNEPIDMAIEALTRQMGEWLSVEIIDDDSYNGVNEDAAECSVCRYVSESYYWAKTYYKFCPNCGARMKISEDTTKESEEIGCVY